jgi:tagaturonate reductase
MNSQSPIDIIPEVIIQFGSCATTQAHVDYFIADSLANGKSSAKVVVVGEKSKQTHHQQVDAINQNPIYSLHVQGLYKSRLVNKVEQVDVFHSALDADEQWDSLVDLFCFQASHVLSNIQEKNGCLKNETEDNPNAIPPKSFAEKLLLLLAARFNTTARPITIIPCEKTPNNGSVLKRQILKLALKWKVQPPLINWLNTHCIWVNSILDRIVTDTHSPFGIVTEPYALWAIEAQPTLSLPCSHPNIRIVESLTSIQWLKFSLLNLSQAYLAHLWINGNYDHLKTVLDAMENYQIQNKLKSLLRQEVIPVLESMDLTEDINAYLESVLERLYNPYLNHQLSELAQDHLQNITRYLLPVYKKGRENCAHLSMPKLKQCLEFNAIKLN